MLHDKTNRVQKERAMKEDRFISCGRWVICAFVEWLSTSFVLTGIVESMF
jgi:hypothetical protein